MNSLNADAVSSLNPAKYRPIDVPGQFYPQNVYYHIPSGSNINPEYASIQNNSYGANSLLATQFSFQYSDSQGLGEGAGHSGQWGGGGGHSRSNPPIDPGQFYSLPSHGHAQTADQNLFYPYGYGATNNMYWPHPSVLEYKPNSQNFPVPAATAPDKNQSWPEPTIVKNQYSPLANTLSYKSNLSSLDPANHMLSNSSQSNYEAQLGSNGYNLAAQVAGKLLGGDDGVSKGGGGEVDSLQAQMASGCALHVDGSHLHHQQHLHQQQAFSKQTLSNGNGVTLTTNGGAAQDFWTADSGNMSASHAAKSYAKAAKLPSRSVSTLPGTPPSSVYFSESRYGSGAPPRPGYKSTTNGFATGFVRPTGNGNSWLGGTSLGGTSWNSARSKWNPEGNMNPLSQAPSEVTTKSAWPAKASSSSTDEYLRNAEYKIKEIQQQINPKRLEINFEKTRYFVIKSYSEDDVHRSIKYKIWCSTKEGNRRLNDAFLAAQKTGGHVLLFFSVNGSGHFCGVAEMVSPVDESVVTGVWCQDKWRGKFSVKWLYVKDVPNTQLRHISTKVKVQKGNGETCNEVKPITNLRDATELKSDRGSGSSFKDDIGYQALKIIMDCKSTMSIFDDFLHYEKRELSIDN